MSRHKVKVELTLHLNYPARALGKRNLANYLRSAVLSWQKSGNPERVWFSAIDSVGIGAFEVIE